MTTKWFHISMQSCKWMWFLGKRVGVLFQSIKTFFFLSYNSVKGSQVINEGFFFVFVFCHSHYPRPVTARAPSPYYNAELRIAPPLHAFQASFAHNKHNPIKCSEVKWGDQLLVVMLAPTFHVTASRVWFSPTGSRWPVMVRTSWCGTKVQLYSRLAVQLCF